MAASKYALPATIALSLAPLLIRDYARRQAYRITLLENNSTASKPISERIGSPVPLIKAIRAQYHLKKGLLRSQLMFILRRMANSKFRVLNSAMLIVYRLSSFDQELQDKFFDAVMRQSKAGKRYLQMRYQRGQGPKIKFGVDGKISGSCNGFPIALDRLSNAKPGTDIEGQADLEARKTDDIHIVLGSDISLDFADWLADESAGQVIIHTMAARVEDVQVLRHASRMQNKIIRETLPDIGDETNEITRRASNAADKMIARLCAEVPDRHLYANYDVQVLALADDLAGELTRLACYRAAIAAIPKEARLVIAGGGASSLYNAVQYALGTRGLASTEFLITNTSRHREIQIWMDVHDQLSTQEAISTNKVDWATYAKRYGKFLSEGKSLASAAAQQAGTALLQGKPISVLLYNHVNAAYGEALNQVLRLPTKNRNLVLIDTSPHIALPSQSARIVEQSNDVVSTSTQFLSALVSRRLDRVDRDIARALLLETEDSLYLEGHDLSPVLVEKTASFIVRKCPAIPTMAAFVRHIAKRVGSTSILSIPSRQWLIRAVSQDAVCNGWATVADLQILNSVKHAKYVAPACDFAAVLDKSSAEYSQRVHALDQDRIHIVGSLRDEIQTEKIRDFDRTSLKARFVSSRSGPCILLASQPEPMARMARIVKSLFAVIASRPDASLIIKMHPREGQDRADIYQTLAQKAGISAQVVIDSQMRPEEALAMCDVCVTVYSNMAREAALNGKGVLLAMFDGTEPPLRHDLHGLGIRVDDENDLRVELEKRIESGDWAATTETFLADNQELLDGKALDRIAALLECCDDLHHERISQLTRQPLTLVSRSAERLSTMQEALVGTDVQVFNLGDLRSPNASSNKHTEAIEDSASLAGEIALQTVDALAECLAGHSIGKAIEKYREGIALLPRAEIVPIIKEVQFVASLLDDSQRTVICDGKDEQLIDLCNQLAHRRGKRLVCVALEDDLDLYRVASCKQSFCRLPSPAFDTTPKATALSPEIEQKLDDWWSGLKPVLMRDIASDNRQTPLLVWTVACNQATVPPTLKPLFQSSLTEGLLANAHHLILDQSDRGKISIPPEILQTFWTPSNLSSRSLDLPKKHREELIAHALARLKAKGGNTLVPTVEMVVKASLDQMLRRSVWSALVWAYECEQVFSNSYSISLSCPGRQWHALIADCVAKQAQRQSITIQNAYMYKGYTYTAPTGSLITAIDENQRELFIRDFGISAERIHVTGTPRFDYLARIKTSQKRAQKRIMVAAQIGYDDIAISCIQWLDALFDGATLDQYTCDICPHPHASEQSLEALKEALAQLKNAPRFSLSQRNSAAELLSEVSLVITGFSNVGLEAAALGIAVLTINPTGAAYPLPLDAMGLAAEVSNQSDFEKTILQLSTAEGASRLRQSQDQYFVQNPATRAGNSSELINQMIIKALEGSIENSK